MLVRKLTESAVVPSRATPGSVGYDLCSTVAATLLAGGRAAIGTGVSVRIPEGTYGRVAPRSGLAVTHGIDVLAGVIDRDFSGEVKVVLINHGDSPFTFEAGDRIAQLIVERALTPKIVVTLVKDDTVRGDGGFGSTGA